MPSESLSPAANKFLDEASKEFNAKQKNLDNEWRFDAYQEWSFDVEKGLLELEFHDGTTLIADGQLLGTYCVSDATFEWAWNNPKFKKVITRDSQVVKEVGETLKLSYTQAGMIPMPAEVYLSYICAIGLKASDSLGMFRGSEGDVHPLIMVKNPRLIYPA